MPKKEATEEELYEVWQNVIGYWDKCNAAGGMIDYPWVRASFNLSVFRVSLAQRNLRVSALLGSASVRRS